MVQTLMRASEDIPFVNAFINLLLLQSSSTTRLSPRLRCEWHDVQLAQLFLSHGASPGTTDAIGRTPLQLAQKQGFYEMIKLLENQIASIIEDKDSVETLVGDYRAYFSFTLFKHLTMSRD